MMCSLRTLLRALFACVCIFGLANSLLAQTYTPVKYNFPSAPGAFSSIDGMAANGYGLWLHDIIAGSAIWELAGNGNAIYASGSDDQGPGTDETKVAANLRGSVRYVTLDSLQTGFIVAGIDDTACHSASTQISLNIPYSGGDNIFNDTSIQHVMTGGEHVYPLVSTKVYGEPCTSPEIEGVKEYSGTQGHPWDWDIAIDGHYLYIVWYHYESVSHCWQGDEIFVTCVKLSDGSVPAGFPLILHTRVVGEDSVGVGIGIMPTVACDVRNNNIPDGEGIYHPACDIAYLDDYSNVHHISVVNGAFNYDEQLPVTVLIPTDSSIYPHVLYANSSIANTVKRARVMVASTASATGGSGMQSHVVGYYVIAGTSEGTSLYFFKESNGIWGSDGSGAYGWFVDGIDTASQSLPPEAAPIGGEGQLVGVPQYQITAFANPYDGQNDSDYDEFHCVYGIVSHSVGGLMIVRGANNGVHWPTSPVPYRFDTRTVVNQDHGVLTSGPSEFYAAANQAGIHIAWIAYDGYFYSRDRRSYDEPIEEPTIVSFDNYVADGRSHWGTLGAQTMPGKFVLVEDSGTIHFGNAGTDSNANAAGLTVGTTFHGDPAAKLILFPAFQCTFQSPPLASNRNFIQIDTRASCDFYGGTLTAGGDFKLDTSTLNIMPGCNLALINQDTTGFPRLISSHGTIISKNGTGPDLLPQDNGIATVDGAMILDTVSLLTSALPGSTLLNFVTLNGEAKCPFASKIIGSSIFDNAAGGQALIYLHDPLAEMDFEQTSFSKIALYGFWNLHTTGTIPSRPLAVTGCTFDTIPVASLAPAAVHLVRDISSTDTIVDYNIVVNNNSFKHFTTDSSDGILLEDFLPNIPGDLATYGTPIDLSGNNFTTASSFGSSHPADTSHVEAAIHLRNTSAVISDDTINGVRSDGTSTFAYGILLDPTDRYSPLHPPIANTLICSNVISHVGYMPVTSGGVTTETGAGIATSYWQGYEKMNDISFSAQGSIFGLSDAGKYLVDSIHDNRGPGINNTADFLTVTRGIEMRGLMHPDTIGDMAGFNVIKNNNLDTSSTSGEIIIAHAVYLHIGNEQYTGSPSITYGENSILENLTNDKLIFGPTGSDVCTVGLDEAPDSCLNYCYYQVAGVKYTPAGQQPETQFGGNVDYWNSEVAPSVLDSVPPNPGISCYAGRLIAKKRGEKPTAMATDTATTQECNGMQHEEAVLSGAGDNRAAYDTAKAYITLCYNQTNAWEMFNNARDDASAIFIPNEFREWLKSVLYLRTDSMWYCADVYAILSTFTNYPGHGIYEGGDVAVVRYILQSQKCDSEWNGLMKNAIQYWPNDLYNVWRDTVKDSLTEPKPDTTVPSIDSIGLSILRGPQYAGVTPSPIPSSANTISGLYVTENPFTNSTAIKFTLADYGLVTFQLFDVLGHAVTTNGIGQVLYPGEHEFDVDGTKLAPGNYIARIAFHNGDVESIMVVKK